MGSHCKILNTEVLSLVYTASGYIFKVKSIVFLNGLELSSERCKIAYITYENHRHLGK